MDDKRRNNLKYRKNLASKIHQTMITERIMLKLTWSEEADDDHPYLRDHGIESHDLSVDDDDNLLAVAVDLQASFTDRGYHPQAKTMLTISPKGKTTLEHRSTSTGSAIMIGHREFRQIAKTPDKVSQIFVVEDYPNGAFLYENLEIPVAVALRLSNIKTVVKILLEKFPKAQIFALLNDDPAEANTLYRKVAIDCKLAGAIVLRSLFIKREAENDLFSGTGNEFFSCNCRALVSNPDTVINNIILHIKAAIGPLYTAKDWPCCVPNEVLSTL